MNRNGAVLLCVAYLIGLLSTATLRLMPGETDWETVGRQAFFFVSVGLLAGLGIPRLWRGGPNLKVWGVAGIIAAVAVVHFQIRIPQPQPNDISNQVQWTEGNALEQVVRVQGEVLSVPRITQNQQFSSTLPRSQFWLAANQVSPLVEGIEESYQQVTGKLYITVPLLQSTGIYPGQRIGVTGYLYKPPSAINPGTLNFASYLAREGAFAGLRGNRVSSFQDDPPWGWWRVRQRIIRAHIRPLGSPLGQVVSSMVLGRQAVDLPIEIRNEFIQAGLAHVLAASGFHVSLLLGVVLTLTQHQDAKKRFGIGIGILAVYVSLTGLQPSVLRAALMGSSALLGLVMQRKVQPLGSLLIAATLLLTWNPLWIWDLGFQLSFFATWGLIVTVPPLQKRLDWLPDTFATLIAIPIAVFPWVLPLQLYAFGVFTPYSVFANIIATPLVIVVSLGGMISAAVALLFPFLGSAIAVVLYYPVQWLLAVIHLFTLIPGNSLALGSITARQVIILYFLIGLVWLHRWWQSRWWFATVLGFLIIFIPVSYAQSTLVQVSVLATNQDSVLVVQDQGRVSLVNSGTQDTARFSVLPFLRQQGIRQIEVGIAINPQPDTRNGWLEILNQVSIQTFLAHQDLPAMPVTRITPQSLIPGESIPLNNANSSMELLSLQPTIFQINIQDQTWLLLNTSLDTEEEGRFLMNLPSPQVFIWSGEPLALEWLQNLHPKVAIASSSTIDYQTVEYLQSKQTQVYWTARDGAIQWSPTEGFKAMLDVRDANAPLF